MFHSHMRDLTKSEAGVVTIMMDGGGIIGSAAIGNGSVITGMMRTKIDGR